MTGEVEDASHNIDGRKTSQMFRNDDNSGWGSWGRFHTTVWDVTP